jgi:hypothetical protein
MPQGLSRSVWLSCIVSPTADDDLHNPECRKTSCWGGDAPIAWGVPLILLRLHCDQSAKTPIAVTKTLSEASWSTPGKRTMRGTWGANLFLNSFKDRAGLVFLVSTFWFWDLSTIVTNFCILFFFLDRTTVQCGQSPPYGLPQSALFLTYISSF